MRAIVLSVILLLIGHEAVRAREKPERIVSGKTITAWMKILQGKDLTLRVRAITALSEAGPQAQAALPALVRLFRDKEPTLLHPLAAMALARIGAKAVPRLEKALDDELPQVRAGAALALGLIGSPARSAQPALTRLLLDRDRLVRTAAAGALEGIRAPMPRDRVALDSLAEYDPDEFPPREMKLITFPLRDAEMNELLDQLLKIDGALRGRQRGLEKALGRAHRFLLNHLPEK
jgi:HEAT repeat protein